jgi:hypothetical protein
LRNAAARGGALQGLDWIASATFDPAIGRLYVSGGAMSAEQLFTIDMATANVLAKPFRQPPNVVDFAVESDRLYIAGTIGSTPDPYLFVVSSLGLGPSRALPAARIFDNLVIGCR